MAMLLVQVAQHFGLLSIKADMFCSTYQLLPLRPDLLGSRDDAGRLRHGAQQPHRQGSDRLRRLSLPGPVAARVAGPYTGQAPRQ